MGWQVILMHISSPTSVKPLCILQFYPKNMIAPNRGATKYQCADKGYGMQPGPDNNHGGSTCSNSVSSAKSLAFLLYSSFFSWTPKRLLQVLTALPQPKYQQYEDIDPGSLMWMFYHPQGWKMWMPDSSPSNGQEYFRVLVIFYLSGDVLLISFEFLPGYFITLFIPVSVRHSVWWEAPPLLAGALRCHLWLWGVRYATRQLNCSNAVSLCHEEDFSFPLVPY